MTGRLWRLPLAWAMVVTFAASAVYAYTAFAWLPTIMTDLAGVDAVQAGLLLALFGAVGLPCSLFIPVLVARYRHAVGALFALAIIGGLVGVAGLAWAPQSAPWLWSIALALLNLLFPLVLVLLNLRTRTHEASVALSGFVQSLGYAIGAAVTFLVSVLHDVTGGWSGVLITLAVVALASAPAGVLVVRPHTVEADGRGVTGHGDAVSSGIDRRGRRRNSPRRGKLRARNSDCGVLVLCLVFVLVVLVSPLVDVLLAILVVTEFTLQGGVVHTRAVGLEFTGDLGVLRLLPATPHAQPPHIESRATRWYPTHSRNPASHREE